MGFTYGFLPGHGHGNVTIGKLECNGQKVVEEGSCNAMKWVFFILFTNLLLSLIKARIKDWWLEFRLIWYDMIDMICDWYVSIHEFVP